VCRVDAKCGIISAMRRPSESSRSATPAQANYMLVCNLQLRRPFENEPRVIENHLFLTNLTLPTRRYLEALPIPPGYFGRNSDNP
jgi:hypothetical protein